MATSMPGSVDTFPTHSAGQQIQSASFGNNVQDALTAVENITVGPTHVNVRQYVQGNGSDEHTGLQQAIDAAGAGGILHYPIATGYRSSVPLVPYSNQTWDGPAGGGPLLYTATGGFPTLICHTNGTVTRTITGFRMTNLTVSNTATAVAATGIQLGSSANPTKTITIDHCEFDHCSIDIWGQGRDRIHDNWVHDTLQNIAIGNRSSNPNVTFDNLYSHVHDNIIENCAGVGVQFQSCLNGNVHDNIVYNSGNVTAGAFAIDCNASRDTDVHHNKLFSVTNGILFEQDAGTGGRISIIGNRILGTAASSGTAIEVTANGTSNRYASVEIQGNICDTWLLGAYIIDQDYVTISATNKFLTIGQNPIVLSRTSGNMVKAIVQSNLFRGWATTVASQWALSTNTANVYVHENHMDATGGTTPGGISGITSGEIIGNTLIGVTTALSGVTATIARNIGIVTENSGSSTGTGAHQTVAHGLAFTPTAAQIALTAGSATAAPFHWQAPDATNIYVQAANTQSWYWATVGR